LNGCVKLALTIQLIEHNQLSAENAKEAEVIDHNNAFSKTHFIVAIPCSKTPNRRFNE
jgi:hypothetical protein